MFFPVANIELSPWVPLLIGFAVSVVSAPTGISGAFLILPISMSFLGFVSPAVSSTNYIFNVVASPAGVWRFYKEKRLMWRLGLLMAFTSLPGILAGTVLRAGPLKEAADFKIFVALVLSGLGLSLLRSIIWGGRAAKAEKSFARHHGDATGMGPRSYSFRHIRFDFGGQSFSVSTLGLTAVSLAVGLVGGIYGLGGAAIISPVLLGVFRLPIYAVSGASLLAGWACSVFGLLSYLFFWPWYSGQPAIQPDWTLGLLFALGGLVGIYCGATAQRFLPPRPLKVMMLLLIATLAAQNFGLF